jgi:D-cysteine desulfhydrase family pyridoxal phosphate-dependent enzyme
MERQRLDQKLQAIPRVPLAEYPTPLEFAPHLSAHLGRPVWIKRDDQIGPGLGGNKTRKLEYLLAEARQRGARQVATFGGLQSNHARLTAAAANRLGMQAHLFYFEPRPTHLSGNLLINRALGAKMYFIPLGGGGGMSLEASIRLVRWLAWLRIGPHYFIPVGGHSVRGGLGYVQAALEIDEQARAEGISEAYLVLAAGSGGTLAGLMAGLALIDSPLRLLGIDVGKLWKGFPGSIARLAEEICAFLGEPRRFSADQTPLIEERYVGEAYGRPSPEGLDAMHCLARLEGVLLDPVYTAKAFAGLLDLSRQGKLEAGRPLIFLHTGGLPALFAFQDGQIEPR